MELIDLANITLGYGSITLYMTISNHENEGKEQVMVIVEKEVKRTLKAYFGKMMREDFDYISNSNIDISNNQDFSHLIDVTVRIYSGDN